MMAVINKSYMRKSYIFLVVNCVLYVQLVNGAEWKNGFESKMHIPEFSYLAKYENKTWKSGSSFNEEKKVRYSPVRVGNIWKPVNLVRYKKSFTSERPWGNVPERIQRNRNNAKYYEQVSKQGAYRQNSFYRNNNYGQLRPSLYEDSDLIYNSRAIYPERFYSYTGLLARPMYWQ